MNARDEIPFAPRHEPGHWQPANYAEQEAAKVPHFLGFATIRGETERTPGHRWSILLRWLMARSDASMHRYRVNGPFWWAAFAYSNGQVTVHLFDTSDAVSMFVSSRRSAGVGYYAGHGRVRFKS